MVTITDSEGARPRRLNWQEVLEWARANLTEGETKARELEAYRDFLTQLCESEAAEDTIDLDAGLPSTRYQALVVRLDALRNAAAAAAEDDGGPREEPKEPRKFERKSEEADEPEDEDSTMIDAQDYPGLVATLLRNKAAHDELDRTMTADETHAVKTYKVVPSEQLTICLASWKQATVHDSLELALCIYTTYFYSVLNKPLRDYNLILKVKSPSIRQLVYDTDNWLMAGFKAAVPVFIRTFRMELKSEWMNNAPVGKELLFNGFTSTHPTLDGVNSMPYDVRRGAFGDVTLPAVLVFEGVFPVLMPQTKYFPGETEYILPAGTKMKVSSKYVLDWYLESDTETKPITVYHLTPASLLNQNINLLPFKVPSGRVPQVPANPDKGPHRLHVKTNGNLDIRAIAT